MDEDFSYAILDALIFDGTEFLDKNKAILVKNGIILDIVDVNEIPKNMKILTMGGLVLAPAFIDLQINGCGGVLYNYDISYDALDTMYKTNLKYGTISFLPTLITAVESEIKKAVETAYMYRSEYPDRVIGIHIEGPYINVKKKGIHNSNYIKILSFEMVEYLIEWVKKIPIMITVAPECNHLDYIKILIDNGVVVAIGHSNATYLEAKKSFDLGINVATHLFNAMSQMEARTPGVVPAVLNDENVYAGIIVDGLHVDYNVIKLAKKIKGEKLFVVTDTATAMGTYMEEFVFGDQRVLVKDGKFVSENGVLAGANISMILSLKNLVKHVNIPLTEALRMLSLYPARVMKIDNQLGKIQVGFKANFVLFDMNYKVNYMIENGQIFDFTDEESENKIDENSENK